MAPHAGLAAEGGGGVSSSVAMRKASAARPDKLSTNESGKHCFSLNEVAKHDRPNDCWLIVHGAVYDVTKWVPKHPGGNLIYVNAGRECTQLFESYHPLYVRKMLDKYFIGEVDYHAGKEKSHDVIPASLRFREEAEGEVDFYTSLKQRVEAFFKERRMNPRAHPHMFIKSGLIFSGYFLCFYAAFFSFHSFWLCSVFAALMGFFAAEVGMSIQHDCNHGSYTSSSWFSSLVGLSLDVVGASSFMWKQQHVVGHHVSTNVDQFDPDIRVADPDVRRVTKGQPRQWYHEYQHVYLGALYGLLSLKSVLLDDFSAFFSGRIGPVKLARMTTSEKVVFWGMKLIYGIYMLLLPLIFGVHSPARFLFLFILSQLVTGWILALLFQVAHVVGEASFPVPSPSAPSSHPALHDNKDKELSEPRRGDFVDQSWAAMQVATTTDFSHGSFFWTHVSGGLNYQIEHHLFPGVCHVYYPLLQPIVKAACEEFGVPYHSYTSFWEALAAHFAHLKEVGMTGVDLSLHG